MQRRKKSFQPIKNYTLHITHSGSCQAGEINIQTWYEAFGTQTVAVLLLPLDAFSLLLLPKRWFQNYPSLNNPIRPFLPLGWRSLTIHVQYTGLKLHNTDDKEKKKTRNTCNNKTFERSQLSALNAVPWVRCLLYLSGVKIHRSRVHILFWPLANVFLSSPKLNFSSTLVKYM